MYPRFEGHCYAHRVPGSMKENDYDESGSSFTHALTILRKKNTDLCRGDLILFVEDIGYRNEGVAIFNGTEIVSLSYDVDDYGSLPQEFRVIEDGVPITYWKNHDDESDTGRGIDHNNIVWFDHKLVREECLKNLHYGEITQTDKIGCTMYGVYTTFSYSGKEYRIIFDYTDVAHCDPYSYELPAEQSKETLTCFRKMLESNDLICFETEAHNYSSDDHTLFILSGLY